MKQHRRCGGDMPSAVSTGVQNKMMDLIKSVAFQPLSVTYISAAGTFNLTLLTTLKIKLIPPPRST